MNPHCHSNFFSRIIPFILLSLAFTNMINGSILLATEPNDTMSHTQETQDNTHSTTHLSQNLEMDSITISKKLLEINKEAFVKNTTEFSNDRINRAPATDKSMQQINSDSASNSNLNEDKSALELNWGKNNKPELWILDP